MTKDNLPGKYTLYSDGRFGFYFNVVSHTVELNWTTCCHQEYLGSIFLPKAQTKNK